MARKTTLQVTSLEDRLTPAAAVPDANFFAGEVHSVFLRSSGFRDESGTHIGAVGFRVRATGPGDGRFQVIDIQRNEVLFDEQPYGENFRDGINLAAGDPYSTAPSIDRYPNDWFFTAPGPGGSARIKAFQLTSQNRLETRMDFISVGGPDFRGGANIAAGYFKMRDDPPSSFYHQGVCLAVGAGSGGGPRVMLYDGPAILGNNPVPYADFFALPDSNFRGGISLAAGSFNYPGVGGELIVGAGPGGAPRVVIWEGTKLGNLQDGIVADFFAAGDSSSRGGVRVSTRTSEYLKQVHGPTFYNPSILVLERPGLGVTELYYFAP